MRLRYFLTMLIALILTKCIPACCQGLDAGPAGVMVSHGHPKGGWMVSYTYENVMMKHNLAGTENVTDDAVFNDYIFSTQSMRMDMHMLMGMYGLSARLSFMLMTNYTVTSMDLILPVG